MSDQEVTQAQCLFHLYHTLGNKTGKALVAISGLQPATGAAPVSKGDTKALILKGDHWMLGADAMGGLCPAQERVRLHIPHP